MGKSPPPHPATSFTSFSYPHYTNIGHLLKLWLPLFTLRLWNIFNLRYKLNEDFHFHRRHLSTITSPSKGVYKQPCSLRCQYQPSLRPERSSPCSSMVHDLLHPSRSSCSSAPLGQPRVDTRLASPSPWTSPPQGWPGAPSTKTRKADCFELLE